MTMYLSLAAFVFSGGAIFLSWAVYLDVTDPEGWCAQRIREEVARQQGLRDSEAHTTMNCGVDVVAQPERAGLRGPARASE